MPNVIACYKWVVDEADVRSGANGELNLDQAGRKISEYDRNAIEEAVQVVEKQGGSVTALCLGGAEIKASAKEALARGATRAVLVMDQALANADSHTTALGLAAAIRQAGAYDLVLCGEGSGDAYAQQVGPRLAALLDIPCVSFVNKLVVGTGGVMAERKLEDGVEVIEARFPVVVTVMPDINRPRIPGLKQVMGAAKKPQQLFDAKGLGLSDAELADRFETKSISAPTSNRKKVLVKDVMALAQEIAKALQ